MTICEHTLKGCAPVPLGSYLKALGVFRLVAEQADEDVKGFWRDERFILRTKLSEQELIAFFTDEYQPSPVISPWNAGSGFYHREGKTKEKDPETGKRIKTGVRNEATAATKALASITECTAARFRVLRKAIQHSKADLIRSSLVAAPTDEEKHGLIRHSRATAPDSVVTWIDAAATLSNTGLEFPPLLGSGGNDGNLDFSTTFIQALIELFETEDGRPKPSARPALEASMLGRTSLGTGAKAISQFEPQSSGGLNATAGFSLKGRTGGSNWDIVLEIEGALLLAGAAARRLGASALNGGAFPFMVPIGGTSAGGAGHVGVADEASGRGEFWAPIWTRPTTFSEISGLFREGRAVVKRRDARSSLDFARAVAELGVNRGIDHFDRHAFEQRNGNMYYAVTLPRRHVVANDQAKLIADLEQDRWLDRISRATRDKASPADFAAVGRRFDDALFRLTADGSNEAVQGVLIDVGRISLECARRPKLRAKDDKGRFPTAPPPRLSQDWRVRGDDQSAEFVLAAALAGLTAQTERDADGRRFRIPFRSHLAPISVGERADNWSDTTESRPLALWTGRNLTRDLAAILERRLIEAQRRNFLRRGESELPLRGLPSAPLWVISEFLAKRTDDQRIAGLAAGLSWVDLRARKESNTSASNAASQHRWRTEPLPFAYSALKPLFNPAGVGSGFHREDLLEGNTTTDPRHVNPLQIVRLLTAERPSQAIGLAQRMARGAGLNTAFAHLGASSTVDPLRLCAALLFPISRRSYRALLEYAYPGSEIENVEEPAHAD